MFLPFAMIFILLLIKNSLKDDPSFKPRTINPVVPEESIKAFSFLDYVTAVLTPRTCVPLKFGNPIKFQDDGLFAFEPFYIDGINPDNWPVPFLKCDFRQCKEKGEVATDYCSINVLALAPAEKGETGRVDAFKAYIEETYPQIVNVTGYDMVKVFNSSQEIDEYVRDVQYGDTNVDKPKIAVAVILGGSGKEYEYTIRTNSTNYNSPEFTGRLGMPTNPNTRNALDSTARRAKDVCTLEGGTPEIGQRETRCTVQYMYNGALTIQRLVDDYIIDDTGVKDLNIYVAENGVSFVDFPSNEYIQDGFYAQVSAYIPLLLILGLLYPVAAIVRSIVTEKELRQKELMKMMSISESAIELSWFLSVFAQMFLSALLVTIASSLLYTNADPGYLFVFWELAFLSITVFAMAVAALFSKSTRATLVSILVFFAGYFLTLSADYATGRRAIISLVSIHPVAALSYGIQIIGNLEVCRTRFYVVHEILTFDRRDFTNISKS
jgi:ATP-binding cassette subfamily A (ABC1) protein 1